MAIEKTINSYEIAQSVFDLESVKVLQSGSQGECYLVTKSDNPHEKYIIKQFNPTSARDAKDLELITREADICRNLDHPQVAQSYGSFVRESETGFGQSKEVRLCVVSKFFEGEDLKRYTEKKGKLDSKEVRTILQSVLDPLEYIHERGIIHRDIKPSNLMYDDTNTVSLIDFGGVKVNADETKNGSTLFGTLGYAAPEQLGGTADARSDLYSLGVTLFNLATGIEPSELGSYGSLQLDTSRITRELRKNKVDSELRTIIKKLTQFNAYDRYQSVAEVREVLEKKRSSKGNVVVLDSGITPSGLIAGSIIFGLSLYEGYLEEHRWGQGDEVTSQQKTNYYPRTNGDSAPSHSLAEGCLQHCFVGNSVIFPYTLNAFDKYRNFLDMDLICETTHGGIIDYTNSQIRIPSAQVCVDQEIAEAAYHVSMCHDSSALESQEWKEWSRKYTEELYENCVRVLVDDGCIEDTLEGTGRGVSARDLCEVFLANGYEHDLSSFGHLEINELSSKPFLLKSGEKCSYKEQLECSDTIQFHDDLFQNFESLIKLVDCNEDQSQCTYDSQVKKWIFGNSDQLLFDDLSFTYVESPVSGLKIDGPDTDTPTQELFNALGFMDNDVITHLNGITLEPCYSFERCGTINDNFIDAFLDIADSKTTTITTRVKRGNKTLDKVFLERDFDSR